MILNRKSKSKNNITLKDKLISEVLHTQVDTDHPSHFLAYAKYDKPKITSQNGLNQRTYSEIPTSAITDSMHQCFRQNNRKQKPQSFSKLNNFIMQSKDIKSGNEIVIKSNKDKAIKESAALNKSMISIIIKQTDSAVNI
jgi:hypothetical protein